MSRPADAELIRLAIDAAGSAVGTGDVPVGAVVIGPDGVELARACNAREATGDPTAHAEVLALRQAAERLGAWRLGGCTLYVTLEPCAMCAGAAVLARVDRLVYGAADPKGGFAGSLGDLVRDPRLNHRLDVTAGVLAASSSRLLRDFFRGRRDVPPPRPPAP